MHRILLCLILLLAQQALANGCYGPPFTESRLKALHEGKPLSALTSTQSKAVRMVFAKMDGRYVGKFTGWSCREVAGKTTREEQNHSIDAQGVLDNPDNFLLTSEVSSSRTSRTERLRLDISGSRLRVNSDIAKLLSVTENSLAFDQVFIVGANATRTVWKITLRQRSLTIEQSVYGNDVLVSQLTQSLTRK